jgi:hypothetical protein
MLTHYFNAIIQATDEHWLKAEEEILKAQSMGLSAEATEAFLNTGVRTHARVWHYAIYAAVLVGVWISGLLLLFLVGKAMSRSKLTGAEFCEGAPARILAAPARARPRHAAAAATARTPVVLRMGQIVTL